MEKSDVLIRKAEQADVDAIVDIWHQLMDDHARRDPSYWGLIPEMEARRIYAEYKNNILESPDYVHLVAVVDNKVVGYINGSRITRPPIFLKTEAGRINEIVVNRDHRRLGVARLLLSAIFKEFAERGFQYTDLMVDKDNPGAIDLYKSMGFDSREFHLIKRLDAKRGDME